MTTTATPAGTAAARYTVLATGHEASTHATKKSAMKAADSLFAAAAPGAVIEVQTPAGNTTSLRRVEAPASAPEVPATPAAPAAAPAAPAGDLVAEAGRLWTYVNDAAGRRVAFAANGNLGFVAGVLRGDTTGATTTSGRVWTTIHHEDGTLLAEVRTLAAAQVADVLDAQPAA